MRAVRLKKQIQLNNLSKLEVRYPSTSIFCGRDWGGEFTFLHFPFLKVKQFMGTHVKMKVIKSKGA